MIKRLLLIASLAAALAACGTSGSSGTPTEALSPIDSAPITSEAPSESTAP
jgi:predicted small lipoprotein YifL